MSRSGRAYASWLTNDPENGPDEIEIEMAAFGALERLANIEGIDISNSREIGQLVDALHSHPDPEMIYALLNHLDRYIHFRADSGEDGWARAHEIVSGALDDLHPEFRILSEAIATSRDAPAADRRRAILATRALSAVPRLVEWIGTSRPVTPTGNLRRADIASAARMLDLYVEGVAKLPPPQGGPDDLPMAYHPASPLYVQSALDAPLLPALWEALVHHDVLRANTSSVRPGPRCEEVFGAEATDEAAEMFAASLVMEIITRPVQQGSFYFDDVVTATIDQLLVAIDAHNGEFSADGYPNLLLQELAHAGFVSLGADGAITIPPLLAGTLAVGVIMAMEYLTADEFE